VKRIEARRHGGWSRRDFLASAAAAAAFPYESAVPAAPIPIIDTHIHLFDAGRPQGAPYKGPKEFTSHVSLPGDYRAMAAPHGVVGAIAVEASFWIEDNLWLLECAQSDDIMVGAVGYLQPETAQFGEYLERFHKNPLYRGIRMRGKEIFQPARIDDPAVIPNLRKLAEADLVLETANPSIDLFNAVLKISDKIPALRIVVDHLPVMDPTEAEAGAYASALKEMHGRSNVYVKLSEILHRVDDRVVMELAAHRERLDHLMNVFGEDRVLFGSDYPNSVGTATFEQVLSLTQQYFATKSRTAAEKYYWKNSQRCYKWQARNAAQRSLAR
jgi:L-fuconolactonase